MPSQILGTDRLPFILSAWRGTGFVIEQPALGLATSAVLADATVSAHDPMARTQNRQRVTSAGRSHDTNGSCMASHVGELAVTPTLAVGNLLKRPLAIEQRTSGEALNERHSENPPLAVEILLQFSLCMAKVGIGLLPQDKALSDSLAEVDLDGLSKMRVQISVDFSTFLKPRQGLCERDSVVLILKSNPHNSVFVGGEQQRTNRAVDNTMSERHARSLTHCCCSGAPGTLPP